MAAKCKMKRTSQQRDSLGLFGVSFQGEIADLMPARTLWTGHGRQPCGGVSDVSQRME